MEATWLRRIKEVNGELLLLLSLLLIAMLLNYMVSMHRVVLGFYVLPTIFSAYFYGRRHATLTALASCCLVVLVTHFNPDTFATRPGLTVADSKWFDIAVWGGTLMVIAYAMGTLYDKMQVKVRELRGSLNLLLIILRQFI